MGIGLAIGAALVALFLRLINVASASRRLEHLNLGLAVFCGVVFLSAYCVRAMRWRTFLAPDKVTVRRAIGIYFIAVFLNWGLPVQGGELAKSLVLRRTNGIPVSRSFAAVTMDKAMDLLPAIVLVALLPLAHKHLSQPLWIVLAFVLVVLGVGLLTLGLASWRQVRTSAFLSRLLAVVLPRRIRERAEPFVVGFINALLALARRPRLLLIGAAYTALAVSLDALFCYLAFRVVGVSVAFLVVLYGYTFYNLAYILPTPPGHLGSNELVGLLIFAGVLHMSRSAVGAMFLFSHPFTGILLTVSGLACTRGVGLKLRTTLALRSDAAPTGDE
jgi:uncharacterized protein (TIRG00374 family)